MSDVDVKLVEGTAFKLEEGKKYLIIFDKRMISRRDAAKLSGNGVCVLIDGNPQNVQIIEDNRKATESVDDHTNPQ